ncbi:MAG: hypothetical protein JST20_04830 [Bacteroidetes bacterium]|nr:hypothetical protein [Bacteroidota bacterium]
MKTVILFLLVILILSESSAQLITSTSYKIIGTNLTIFTNFKNSNNISAYVLVNNWSLFCYSTGDMMFSRLEPNCNFIFIIPQTWNKENKKIFFHDERLPSPVLKCYPYYYLIPKHSIRRLSYTITFENQNRMLKYLTDTKLVLYYTYQTSHDIDSMKSLLDISLKKQIFRGKTLVLKDITKIDPIKKELAPNTFDSDLKKDIILCKNFKTLTDNQSFQFRRFPKKATKEEYISIYSK